MRPENLTINHLNETKTHDYADPPNAFYTLCDGMEKIIEQCVVVPACKFLQYLPKYSKIHVIINFIINLEIQLTFSIFLISLTYVVHTLVDDGQCAGKECGEECEIGGLYGHCTGGENGFCEKLDCFEFEDDGHVNCCGCVNSTIGKKCEECWKFENCEDNRE